MAKGTMGIAVSGKAAIDIVAEIEHAEALGVPAAWMTSGGVAGDSLAILTAAAMQTRSILLGTSIVPLWSRHPVTLAQQTQAAANLAPGRFRLGVGPSHKQSMERTMGVEFREPLGHLREYIAVLKALLHKGEVDFEGAYYKAHTKLAAPVDVPILASALRPKSFELCGEFGVGAITWVCPLDYVFKSALPALQAGAKRAGNAAPPLAVHMPVCVGTDAQAVRDGVREQLGYFPKTVFYELMFAEAGFLNSSQTGWTDALVDAVAIYGDESQVVDRLRRVIARGADEVIATVITTGADRAASAERTMRAIAKASRG
jgi:F420-dependent oxidoreductase-like protein